MLLTSCLTVTACGRAADWERMGPGCASVIWTGAPTTGFSQVVPAQVTTVFTDTDGRQRAGEVSPKVTAGRASVIPAPGTTGLSGGSEAAVTVFGTDVTSGFGVCSTPGPAAAPPAAAAGPTGCSVTTPALAPPGPAKEFRLCTDTVLGVAAPETPRAFPAGTEESVAVTAVTGVEPAAAPAAPGVC